MKKLVNASLGILTSIGGYLQAGSIGTALQAGRDDRRGDGLCAGRRGDRVVRDGRARARRGVRIVGRWLFSASLAIGCAGAALEAALDVSYLAAQCFGWNWSENQKPKDEARFSLMYTIALLVAMVPSLARIAKRLTIWPMRSRPNPPAKATRRRRGSATGNPRPPILLLQRIRLTAHSAASSSGADAVTTRSRATPATEVPGARHGAASPSAL